MNGIDNWLSHFSSAGRLVDFTDKEDNKMNQIFYYLMRTQSMFEWKGLPDTIPQRMLELYLQINGYVGFYHTRGNLYVFRGALGGEPDEYYMPTIFTIANPAFNLTVNAKINEDCIVVPNDTLYRGLMPLFDRYTTLISENELSMEIGIINSRIVDIISATTDRSRKSAEKYLEDIRSGKLGVVSSEEFLEGVKAQPYGSTGVTNTLTNLIEMEQYLKASLFNEIGLNSNYNMKRESLNSEESQLNHDALLPLVEDMLRCRQLGAEMVNDMYGTDISVEFSSSWRDNVEEAEAELDALKKEAEEPEPEPEPETKEGEDDE